jgi:predicted hotdog family 3-hydroxylacyl-ACP dehydratase
MTQTSFSTPAGATVPPFVEGQLTILGMQRTWWRFAALRALMAIGCPDRLADGPRTVAELAEACDAHAPTLSRLLRNIAQTGLLRTVAPDTYELTPTGRALLGGHARQSLLYSVDDEVYNGLGELTETVRTGVAPFTTRHGALYNYLSTDAELSAVFDALMDLQHEPLAVRVGELLAASGLPAGATVVDVGGAKGTFVAAILRANPGMRGILLDLERSAALAGEYLAAAGVAERCEVVAGDFFKAVPGGGDAYLLAHIVHNWDDEQARAILRSVRAVVPDDGRLLIVEAPIPEGDEPHFAKDLDIRLLTMHEGQERTVAEYESMLADAGFRLADSAELSRGECLLTAVPVTAHES